ncbi:putative multicopper oxidase [Candidatus Burkholderia verschuerenii]|uniref:Putative multicopper oxidase n=1 Tax=Candidatus Burkholderia verschuerenii TaxID=242163 RepID=A0A0L0MBA6_9BURK|nr:multicopper oxidase domain-containing protein [Candidatus Burkholderia verschuerenii]KND59555.1 putative multicopper oxidase [Candidatus Burkholderia verschuerenii]
MRDGLAGPDRLWPAVLFALLLLPAPGFAQANLNARSFTDLDDTSDASSDNSSVSTSGGLTSILQRLSCAYGLNPGGNSASISLSAQMASYRIFNPSTNAFDQVSMRSYNGCPSGPTISIKPGATLRLKLFNNLPVETATTCPPDAAHNTPHCFNTTNIHTHGLHVSPSDSADNIFVEVPPSPKRNASFHQYVYELPADHPSGTFWYHAHLHGSTAIDVASGMAGVLIVRGSRPARSGAKPGSADIDTILHRRLLALPLREHVMLFQQIEYGCFDSATSTAPLVDTTTYEWTCPSGSTGKIRGYDNQLSFLPDKRPGQPANALNSTWIISGRYTQINGVVQPLFPSAAGFVPAGDIRRLRMVHGGNRDTINVKIVRANLSALGLADSTSLSAAQVNTAATAATNALAGDRTKSSQVTTLDRICSGETVTQLEFAEDGITLQSMIEKNVNTMNPGYRSDVLVAFPSPGLYCILDEAAAASATINFLPNAMKVKDRRLLSFARVGPGVNLPNTTVGNHTRYWQYIRDQLVAANPALPFQAKTDLTSLKLTAFAPTIPVDRAADETVKTGFEIDPTVTPPTFTVNGSAYNPSNAPIPGTLGDVAEWSIKANPIATHVFHIHTNPFQIVDIFNGAQASVFADSGDGCSQAELGTGDTEYCHLKGVVRDTVFIKPNYTVIMKTAYQDYTGKFVMHCHILDHEDRGMMAAVQIKTSAGAALDRLSAPFTAVSKDAGRWLARLRGKSEAQIALEASLCSARDFGSR